MLTITQLARAFGLSRSTLLYYDRLGLLRPGGRSLKAYRQYTEEDRQRLARICSLRAAGLPLAQIAQLLDDPKTPLDRTLERHLQVLNAQLDEVRHQQALVASLLGRDGQHAPKLSKAQWVALLRASGLDDDGTRRFHACFERDSPLGHQEFLASLDLSAEEIEGIRARSRQGG